ncbi:hypothetical protein [Marinicella gelatinilytica]|uniref:hypothetical protein n=1 Tax=Marinicella gelatinilytica TaxID=2996017 RepID=UPI00226081F6|nr:hypothetical protein [Marinicella gelatinilytica]MCX7544967.1 hypothetical protein [Marinicella gelatinilytica]
MKHKTGLLSIVLCSILIFLIAPTTSAELTVSEKLPEQYIRMAEDGNALQVALVRFKPRTGQQDWYLDLVSAVHVADARYFADLNSRFAEYDTVLYEMVAPEGTKITPRQHNESGDKASAGKNNLLTNIQLKMTDILGLTYQMDGVDYSPKHFVHADFSPDEFKKSMANRGETITGMILQMWRAGLARDLTAGAASQLSLFTLLMADDKQHALKRMVAQELADAESIMTAFEGPEGSTLVAARNQKALNVLKRTLVDKKPQSVAIFYGAAHMQDFQQRLIKDFDLVPTSIEWLDAWNLQ